MTNGDTVQGILETEDIEIELDVGSVIEVYQDRIDRIFFKEGYVPDGIPSIVTSSPVAAKGNFVLVEKGSFTMGDTWGDGERDEKPTHKVTFTYNFYWASMRLHSKNTTLSARLPEGANHLIAVGEGEPDQ
jgi:hypothetical protein